MSTDEADQSKAIQRGVGTTESEKQLATLADRTFLNLWSYPNLYIDKKTCGKGDGKELCDLLVVCGDHIIVFSDKTIAWPDNDDEDVSWRRWYKRAIRKSAGQVVGALRWLEEYPDRVFLDKECTQQLPLPLPPNAVRQVHGVVVARGAGEACVKFFGEGNGSLMVTPMMTGADHYGERVMPFCVGDINPQGAFIHVLDDATLGIALQELDTVTDLTRYLTKKEELVRSGRLITAGGEEDLIAYYMTHMNAADEHDFTRPDGTDLRGDDAIAIDPSTYTEFRANPQYGAKNEADQISYMWDRLIETFTSHMLAGTTLTAPDEPFVLSHHEQGVRHMALVPRYKRRIFAEAIAGALAKGKGEGRFTRGFLPRPDDPEPETGFFFMTLAVPKIKLDDGYEQYRLVRRNMLECYALTFLRKYPHLKRVVGIATEPLKPDGDRGISSEDLMLAEQPEWTDELKVNLKERQEAFDVARKDTYTEYSMRGNEFPENPVSKQRQPNYAGPNRKQRRAMAAEERRRKRKR